MIRHQVRADDTIEGISVQYGIQISHLKRLNRIWRSSEIAVRDHLYIPLRMCSPTYSIAYIEFVNRIHSEADNGAKVELRPIDLIEVVLEPAGGWAPEGLAPDIAPTTHRPRWPLLPGVGGKCQLDGCGVLDFLPVVCDACRKQFCATHGCAAAHQCSAPSRSSDSVVASQQLGRQQASTPVSVYTHPQRTGPKDARPSAKRELTAEQALALEAHQLLRARVGQKATIRISEPRKSPKIELMRLKAKATGNPSIDVDDRIYLCIKHKTKSLVVFEAK
ncbi:hypothetical protein IWW57_002783, partial [Coemansia sp. S610]